MGLSFALLMAPPSGALAQTADPSRPGFDDIQFWSPLARLLSDAQTLIASRQFRTAYRLLEPQTDLYAGDVEFDYLLGLSALESGRPGEAVLALERVLINDPRRLRARAEISRAYVAMEEQENARREFKALASQELPPETHALIGRYLNAVTRVADQPDPLLEFHASFGIGWDDKVDIGATYQSWVLADGIRVAPAVSNRRTKSAVFALGGGVRTTVPINGRLQWTTGVSGILQSYPSAQPFDQEQIDLSTGFAYRNQCHQVKMLGQLQVLGVDYESFRNAVGLVGQWQCDLDAHRQLGGFVQRFEFRFPEQEARDASRQSVGVSYAQLLPRLGETVVLGTIQTGREYSKAGLANLSHDFTGIRMMVIRPIASQLRASLGVSFEHRRFDGADPLFGITRDDRQSEITLSLHRDITEHWTIEPQIMLTRNRSSLAASDFSRTQAQLVARYRLP